jgi:L-rhamnose mutarotase
MAKNQTNLNTAAERLRWKAMKRVGFWLQVKADRLDEYKERHQNVWPEMLDALREAGWHNYSLFLREDGLLFGYVETDDLPSIVAAMSNQEVNHRWQEEMASFFETTEGRAPDKSFIQLEEVFHLD